METLLAVIFVQGFIWGALLLKKARSPETWLGLSFVILGALIFLEYSERVYNLQVPQIIEYSSFLLLFLLTGYHQYDTLELPGKRNRRFPMSTLVILLILILLQALAVPENRTATWLLAGAAGFISFLLDGFFLNRRIRKKIHTGSILDLSNYLLQFHVLTFKALVILMVLTSGTSRESGGSSLSVEVIFQALLAAAVFSTGYHAVQFSYVWKPARKKPKRTEPLNEMGKGLIQLMEEKKPYLDCELTLGRVAELLELSENELTRLLHQELRTSFYDLINGYRIAAVKEKLLEPDSKKYTILSAAYESGFNSSSTFYRIFKEHTGMQPGEFIRKNG